MPNPTQLRDKSSKERHCVWRTLWRLGSIPGRVTRAPGAIRNGHQFIITAIFAIIVRFVRWYRRGRCSTLKICRNCIRHWNISNYLNMATNYYYITLIRYITYIIFFIIIKISELIHKVMFHIPVTFFLQLYCSIN